jgi:hypothetical protein
VFEEQPGQIGVGSAKVRVQLQRHLELSERAQGLVGAHEQLADVIVPHS